MGCLGEGVWATSGLFRLSVRLDVVVSGDMPGATDETEWSDLRGGTAGRFSLSPAMATADDDDDDDFMG
jgi:hypothetical protein